MKKAVFYGRYSSANQTEQSIEGQLHVCEKYAAENDILIVGKYIDRALSGTTDKRPQFLQMIADSAHGGFDTVLVYKLDRFARNRYDSAIHKKKLRDNGVRVVSATEPLSDTPEGIILEGMLESIDEYFSKELSRKVTRGLHETIQKGYYISTSTPLGYKIVDRRLELNPETLPIIRRIFTEYADGKAVNRIANDLNAEGLTVNGRAFKPDTIHRWLCNELFIGKYKYGELTMEVPAAVDMPTWERVQSRKSEARTRYRERTPDFHYFLTGKAVCGTCGGKLCGHPTKTNYNYYYCRNCRKHIIQADKLHDKIKYALFEYMTEDKIKELAAAAYEEYQHSKPEDPTIPLRTELKEVEKRIENGTNAILSGKAPESLLTALTELEARRDTLKKTISECDGISPIFTREHFEYALSQILDYSVEDTEKLVNIFIDRVIVTKERIIICINLTNEASDPPLDRVCIERTGESANRFYAHIFDGWLMIAA